MTRFEFDLNKRGQHYWKLFAKFSEEEIIVADSAEDYPKETTCRHGADLFVQHGPTAPVHIVHNPPRVDSGPGYDWECFPDKAGKWRWHFQANNNEIIADSGNRTFNTPEEAVDRVNRLKALLLGLTSGGAPSDKHLTLVVIVSGTPTKVETNAHQKMRVVAEKALEQTGNSGRPLQDWTLQTRQEPVETLNLDTTVGDYHLTEGAQLVMTLRAGVGG